LELTGRQLELVQAVVGTKTPTVVVLINGRPLAIPWIAEHVPAILEAWNCGERGGDAVADILFGDCDPGGRLSVTVPRHAGQLPVYYDYSPTKESRRRGGYVDLSAEPLYDFGFGLSYTDFAYENLSIVPQTIRTGGRVTVSMDITNTGRRAGQDVVQLYVNDVLSSVTTPVRALRGFEKVTLEPGGRKRVTFELGPEELSLLDRHLERVVEPGEFEVMIGRSSRDIKLTGTFTVVE
jgi:beta-glucosidase